MTMMMMTMTTTDATVTEELIPAAVILVTVDIKTTRIPRNVAVPLKWVGNTDTKALVAAVPVTLALATVVPVKAPETDLAIADLEIALNPAKSEAKP